MVKHIKKAYKIDIKIKVCPEEAIDAGKEYCPVNDMIESLEHCLVEIGSNIPSNKNMMSESCR